MQINEYREKLIELAKLPLPEYRQKIAALQFQYLAGQKIPDAATAAKIISEHLPDMPHPNEDDCELMELLDESSPDDRCWRCGVGEAVVDISAESGEVFLMCV